ncbi:MAG: Gfo/Idh/MocA family oxidoreductase [Geodermatophilaceae bacterium]|nr:Gfo/Idh/MocA family oxidoreductase [Geodermatophilaceae bacterium]MDQ3454866.1 Gfo/Idh/MocA family oxidoreductase [Actinomycetota bacterium]
MRFPQSRVPDPAGAPALRWGILAPGGIAATFVTALRAHTRQQVVAVGSRSPDRAAAFAARHEIGRWYGSYTELVDDPAVQAVYVASPTGQHHEHTLLALAAGKHVLVEKSFALDAGQAREMATAARTAGLVLVEAMWTRFLPHVDVVDQLVRDGVLGSVETVLADHGQLLTPEAAPRLHRPDLGGGALLDLGVYPVAFADLVLGAPDRVTAVGGYADSGVDAQLSAVLRTGAAHAVVTTTLTARTPTTAAVCGTAGRVEIAADFYTPATLTLTTAAGRVDRPLDPIRGHDGLCFPAAHVAQLVADGRADSPVLPLATSVRMMETMDEIRRQLALD